MARKLKFITFFLFLIKIKSEIYQISSPNEIALMNFSLELKGGEMECNNLLAQYNLTIINITLLFNGNNVYSSYPYDLFLLIYNNNNENILSLK